ncbi:probable 2-oxoglutarate-dependent dioxygenase AOP1 [Rutidosis leptorrhynchoides]|uniref:probable 2-oxoglutarate-dependent dioxygenase AOP1 n=1 Tax=Rutidosis leptorrhynchoides TaxID=125765 RepID=UPI003A995534
MDSQAPLKLRTINFSEITKQMRGTPTWNSTKTQVFEALEELGCFEASFNGISPELQKSMFAYVNELFDLPFETKVRNFRETLFNSYLGQAKEIPIFESLAIDDPESFANLMWPHGNTEFINTIRSYSKKLEEMEEIVKMMVLESLNLEKYMEEHMELTSNLIRITKYRTPNEDESHMGLLSHRDKSMVTILHENEVQGLEVQTKDGKWFKVKFSEDSFVVMVGETFRAWTNGRLHATTHKVVMSGNEDRYSIGYFSFGKLDKIIKTPEEMVDEEHPLLFKPYTYGEFIKFYYTKENKNEKFALEKFCGV